MDKFIAISSIHNDKCDKENYVLVSTGNFIQENSDLPYDAANIINSAMCAFESTEEFDNYCRLFGGRIFNEWLIYLAEGASPDEVFAEYLSNLYDFDVWKNDIEYSKDKCLEKSKNFNDKEFIDYVNSLGKEQNVCPSVSIRFLREIEKNVLNFLCLRKLPSLKEINDMAREELIEYAIKSIIRQSYNNKFFIGIMKDGKQLEGFKYISITPFNDELPLSKNYY